MNKPTTQIRRIAGTAGERPAWRSLTVRVALIAMLLVLATGDWAEDKPTISVIVSDPTGAVVANVSISLTSVATGQTSQAASNTSFAYSFVNVGAGHYILDASVTGFQKYTKTDIVVHVTQ